MTSVIGIPRGTRLEQVVLVRGEVHVWIAARERHLPYEQWQGTFLRAGTGFTYSWGLRDSGSTRSWMIDGFANLKPWKGLIGALRASSWRRSTASDDSVLSLTGAVGWEFDPALQTFLAVTRSLPSDDAQAALPDTDYLEARAIARVAF